MVGTIVLYTDFFRFKQRMQREIKHIKKLYPDALYIGVADGAVDNWSFLKPHTSKQVTDFWHACEYLAQAADAIFPTKKEQLEKRAWLDERCHKLKHLKGAVTRILKELRQKIPGIHSKRRLQMLHKAVSYFTHQKSRPAHPSTSNFCKIQY